MADAFIKGKSGPDTLTERMPREGRSDAAAGQGPTGFQERGLGHIPS